MNNEIDSQIEFEHDRIKQMNLIQDELKMMNRSLNNCVDIAYSSAINPKNIKKYEMIKEELSTSYKHACESIDNSIMNSQKTIHTLDERKEKKEEED